MFTKTLILVLLGTSLVLAKSSKKEGQIEQDLIEEVHKLLYKVDKILSKYHHKGDSDIKKVVKALKGKNDAAAAIVEEKWTKLEEEYQQVKKIVEASVQEKVNALTAEIEGLKGQLTKAKAKELKLKIKLTREEEKDKAEADLKVWQQKVKEVIDEAKKALKEIKYERILNQLKEQYGEIFEASKEKLIALKQKYVQLKEQAKNAIAERRKQLKTDLVQLQGQDPKKYKELKHTAHKELAVEKAKWKLQLKQVKQEIREVIQNIKYKFTKNKYQPKNEKVPSN